MERISKNIKRFLLFWSIVAVIVLFAQVVAVIVLFAQVVLS